LNEIVWNVLTITLHALSGVWFLFYLCVKIIIIIANRLIIVSDDVNACYVVLPIINVLFTVFYYINDEYDFGQTLFTTLDDA